MAGTTRTPSARRAPERRASQPQASEEQHASNGIGRQRITEIQRARMLAAMFEVASELGAANVSVAHIVTRASVSRRTFYEIFDDREDCFLAAFEEAVRCAHERLLAALESCASWRERMRAGLTALLEFLDDEPLMGRVLVVEALAEGPKALERRRVLLGRLIGAVDDGRAARQPSKVARPSTIRRPSPRTPRNAAKAGREPSELTAEGVVGAVFAVIHARMLEDPSPRVLEYSSQPLTDLAGSLMSMIVLPYLGSAAARRELERPAAARTHERTNAISNPLQGLEMRLTYRTVRVLLAIAANPRASNRQIAQAADIADQGQMSKLLARLHQNGLIENAGGCRARGEPNAWTLTVRGREFERAIHTQV